MSTYREEWAAEVREGLAQSGMSYQQVAEKVGCSKAYIGDWIGKKVPRRTMVERWATAMGRDPARALIAAGYLERPLSGGDVLIEGLALLREVFGEFGRFRFYRGISGLTPERARNELRSIEAELREARGLPSINPEDGLFGSQMAYPQLALMDEISGS